MVDPEEITPAVYDIMYSLKAGLIKLLAAFLPLLSVK
jgi:hypothetical protein